MQSLRKIIDSHPWLLLIIFSVIATDALLVPGFYGASDDVHIAWLYEIDQIIKAGKFPPRFVPDLSYGFGYPLFNFVFPLPFYLGEAIHLIGLNLVDSVKTIFLLSVPLSALLMYKFLKEFTNKWISLLGAALYIFTPYRAVDLYVRGAIGEVVSFVFLPLLAWSVVKLTLKKQDKMINWRWIGITAIAIGGLILSHNITAYMFLPLVILLSFLRVLLSSDSRGVALIQVIFAFLLGWLLSLYFWLPALLDSKLMRYDTVFNFADHFPTLRQLITPYWGYGGSVPGPGDGMSFFMGVVNLAVIPISILLSIFHWRNFSKSQRSILIWALLSLVMAIFFMNYRSSYLWQKLPFLPYFQFPWRFLMVTTLITPILLISLNKIRLKASWITLILLLIVLPGFVYFKPQDFLGRQDDYYLNRYIPQPRASVEYTLTQEEYLRLPKDTKIRPDRNYPQATINHGQIERVAMTNSLDTVIDLNSSPQSVLSYNKYYFPGWMAWVDNKPVDIQVGQPFGQITLRIPEGTHQVKISFAETARNQLLDMISLLCLLLALSLILKPHWFGRMSLLEFLIR